LPYDLCLGLVKLILYHVNFVTLPGALVPPPVEDAGAVPRRRRPRQECGGHPAALEDPR
jgi:hypothetical protein